MTFGERLEEARLKEGLGPDQLAERLGVHCETVRKWERDVAIPRPDLGQRLLRELPRLGDVPERVRRRSRNGAAMEATTVYFRADQVEGLRILSDEKAQPMAKLIRKAVDDLLASDE